jgi:hypothetical protein
MAWWHDGKVAWGHGAAWCLRGMALHKVIVWNALQHAIGYHDLNCQDIRQICMTWHGMALHGMALHKVLVCDALQHAVGEGYYDLNCQDMSQIYIA